MRQAASGQRNARRIAAASLMLGVWIGLTIIVASPQLHTWVHHDAQNVSHTCVVTQLTKGHLLSDSPAGAAVAPPAQIQLQILIVHDELAVSPRFSLPLGRAPPAILLSIPVAG